MKDIWSMFEAGEVQLESGRFIVTYTSTRGRTSFQSPFHHLYFHYIFFLVIKEATAKHTPTHVQ